MGKILAGRYELLKQIAVGGMATVHLSRALGVGGFERLVAIKVMHPHIGAEPDFVTMFLDEARLAARIRHPNVVPTLDVQESPDGLFLVMEYIEGPSLHQLIKATAGGNGIPLPVVLRMTIDTLSGLHDAHELTDDEGQPLALVHRDVSPANVLIGTDGVARITDFGVARAEARLSSTRGGQLKGKIPYMPPEQLMSEQIDRRCDVYAAGAMLWETLVGRRLFQADSDGALLQKILAGPEASPRQLNPHIPPAIDAVCMQALARDKHDRFATTADFADALERAAQVAGTTVASARAVAAFVDGSGAYRKLSAKEIAALKSGAAIDAPPSRASLPSQPTSKPDLQDPPKSTPTAPSQVTSAGSALSARVEPPRPRRTGLYAAAVGMLLAGAAAAVVLGPKNAAAPAGPQLSSAKSGAGEAAPSAAPAQPTASEAAAREAVPSSSAAPSASSAPTATAPVNVGRVRVPPPKEQKPPPAKPPPTSYSPDRL